MMKNCIKILIFFIFSYFALIGTSVAKECTKGNTLGRLNNFGYEFTQNNEWEKALNCFIFSAEKYKSAYAQSWIGDIYTRGYGVSVNYEEAVQWFLKAAEQGDDYSQGSLGYLYAKGLGVEQSDEEAVQWFLKAAEQGEKYAQGNLGWHYAEGLGVEQSHEEAVQWFLKAAEQGDAYSQGHLGWHYGKGMGVEQSDEEAIKWILKGVEQGDAYSQSLLGWHYGKGIGVEQSDEEAVQWFLKAAEQGEKYAQGNLGWHYAEGLGVEQSYEESFKWFLKGAEQGDAYSQGRLGYSYESGSGVEVDYKNALKWYLKAAEQGDAYSQGNIGYLYTEGLGVEQSHEEAVQWFLKAAEQGDAYSQGHLGWHYAEGVGVEQSDEEAVQWFLKAAKQGSSYSQERMGWHYAEGVGVEQSDEEAVQWYLLAAEQGDVYAQKSLGYHYENGLGVKQSNKEAFKWYSLAAAENNTYAKNHLNALVEKDPTLNDSQVALETSQKEEIQKKVLTEESLISSKVLKPLDKEEISRMISRNEELEETIEGFILDNHLKIEPIDRKALVVYETFIREKTNVTSQRKATVSKGSSIWIAGKVKNTDYYLVNDLNGIPIGFILMSNISLDDSKTPMDDFNFGPYYALLIANNDYLNEGFVDLETPINDAKAIESVLKNKYGFKVELLYDATENQIQDAISSYSQILTENDNFLIYYAGHGYLNEISQVGYWQGVDAKKGKSSSWVANSDITNEIKALKSNHIIVIADSCYSGTLIVDRTSDDNITKVKKNRRDFLKKKHNKKTRVAISSGDDEERVADSEIGSNHSPFAESFIRVLEDNNNLLYSSELHALIESHMMGKDIDQLPLWGKIIGTGHIDGGDFPFQSIE